jgi:dTDP-4-amino-4,6-dideoxygalactose transaminase
MKNKISLLVPRMPTADQIVPYLQEIDSNKHYTNFGPLNKRLEKRVIADIAPHLNEDNISTVANCTIGLELALQAHGLAPGSKVLMPSLTFVATATAIIRAGMTPVFADVARDTWALEPGLAEPLIRSVDAVMPVSTFGYPQDVEGWDELSDRYGKPVLIDAAGAYGNQKVGKVADVIFSFHSTKSFGAGEGGVVISPSAARIATIRRLSNFGIDTSRALLVDLGTNGKMSEYHCAVGLAMYDQWDRIQSARRSLLTQYQHVLATTCPSVELQAKPETGVYPILPVLLPNRCKAVEVAEILQREGIETRRWYCPPTHLHPALRSYPTAGALLVSEDLGDRILGLPFHLDLSSKEIDFVASRLAGALSELGVVLP